MNRTEWTHPDLQSLSGLFFDSEQQLGEFVDVQAEEIPQPYRSLLAHTNHMTVSMETYHGSPVVVSILDRAVTDSHYSRKIILLRESDQRVVQFGIVRLNKSFLSDEVQSEIESENLPLGRILIEHNVMRTVKLMTLWKIVPGQALRDMFESPDLDLCYGRTALIYTNGIPAVELLEIAANA